MARWCFYRYDDSYKDSIGTASHSGICLYGPISSGSITRTSFGPCLAHVCYIDNGFVGHCHPEADFVHTKSYKPSFHSTVQSCVGDSSSTASKPTTIGVVSSATWYPDSGATTHMTNDPFKFSCCNPYIGSGKVIVGNGNSASIFHIGESYISSGSIHIPIIDLLYFTTYNNVFFEFHPSCCYVKDLVTHKILLQGVESNGLYQLLPIPSTK
ncbi:hypothetical protein V6Z12_D06G071200 [Gossypium hirsutum]